jgi:HAD superfamily hydrolase (TIGR01549 family)
MNLDAILWDYDGTLVNSAPKNIDITKQILSVVAPHLTGRNLPASLQSESAYHEANHKSKNWQELYQKYYGLTIEETIKAGPLWTKYQAKNNTPVNFYPGIQSVIRELASFPHGICSQNSSKNIWRVLKEDKLHTMFKAVIGYSDVANSAQKPLPDSGIQCLAEIFSDSSDKTIMYIGDHEADVHFAHSLGEKLGKRAKVIAVAVTYSGSNPQLWDYQPDFTLAKPKDLLKLIQYLGSRETWYET